MRYGRPPLLASALAAAFVVAVMLVFIPSAQASLYWANQNHFDSATDTTTPGSIGRANTDGTGATQSLVGDVNDPCAVAVDGQHVYWAGRTGRIGRANLDGSGANRAFITAIHFNCGQIAVDSEHIYWTEQSRSAPTGIGRANLDGSGVDPQWIPGVAPQGLAIDSDYVYWTQVVETKPGSETPHIARAKLDGTGIDPSFIVLDREFFWLATDGARIYASPLFGDRILRANVDGTGVDPDFIDSVNSPTCGLAADAEHLYWGNPRRNKAVGRANLDGTEIDPSFITGGTGDTCGVAIGPDAGPGQGFSLGKVKRNRRRGTATLIARVPGTGKLRLAGKGIKKQTRRAGGPGKMKLAVRTKGEKRRKLNRNGFVRVRAKVSYASHGGEREIKTRRIRLLKA